MQLNATWPQDAPGTAKPLTWVAIGAGKRAGAGRGRPIDALVIDVVQVEDPGAVDKHLIQAVLAQWVHLCCREADGGGVGDVEGNDEASAWASAPATLRPMGMEGGECAGLAPEAVCCW